MNTEKLFDKKTEETFDIKSGKTYYILYVSI